MFQTKLESVLRREQTTPTVSSRRGGKVCPFQKAINLLYLKEEVFLFTFQNSQSFGGDLDSTGGMRQRLHARDAVGP